MRHLTLDVYEPGDQVGVLNGDQVAVFVIASDGTFTPTNRSVFATLAAATDDPLEVLDLTVRSFNILKREGIDTVGDLLVFYNEHGAQGIEDLRNCGTRGYADISAKLIRHLGAEVLR